MRSDSILQLDITVSESGFKDGAKEILRHIRPSWKSEDINFKMFTDGITNKLMGCRLGDDLDDMILVRVNGAGSEVMIDRNEEQETFRVLSETGLAPPVYCVFQNGMAYGFFPGKTTDVNSVREPSMQKSIAKEMVRLHHVRGSYADRIEGPLRSQYQTKAQAFLESAPTHFDDPDKHKLFVSKIPTKSELQRELDSIIPELEALDMEVVFSHNDLLLGNIIYNEDKDTLHFIDYEYAFYNYEAFDIANHFAEYAGMDDENLDYNLYPGREEQLRWLMYYLHAKAEADGKSTDTVTEKDIERLYVQTNKCACASHFFWGVWALIQAEHSTISFDYISYASVRFTEYFRRKKEFFPLQLPS